MSQSNSRVKKQEKKRKSNLFLNIATGVVLILIVIVSVAIFTGGGDVERADEPELSEAEQAAQRLAENGGEAETGEADEQEDQTDSASLTEAEKQKAEEEKAAEEKEKQEAKAEEEKKKEESESEEQTEESNEEGSDSETANGEWEPIGTQQEDDGNHVSSYDEGSIDWQEKLDAIAYASGIPVEDMTVWFLGNHQGDPKQSVGTVSDSSTPNERVRVYLQWVDNEGWMPTKLEEL